MAVAGCASAPPSTSQKEADRWILTGTRIYRAPDLTPMENAWVYVEGGRITAMGAAQAERPAGARVLEECSGGVITAGFQNSHVHFTDASLENAANRSPEELQRALDQMLTRYGFTQVVDTGSDITNTAALSRRIVNGDLRGPRILTAGLPLYPLNGIPVYLKDLPPQILQMLPQPADAAEATKVVRENFTRGARGTKLFVATPQADRTIKRMDPEIARAAVAETHARGGLVMAHPTDPQGVADAVKFGVDILVHTTIDSATTIWPDALVQEIVAARTSVIPTLKLWRFELARAGVPIDRQELVLGDARTQLSAFARAGGTVLFGTDVGYMTDMDPTEEYVQMARAGLTPMQILASLTTAPAARWNEGQLRGRVQAGQMADLVVLNGDPAEDVKHFADVKCTIRSGKPIFTRQD
jgi:imidazolonepropionase-like amidohydrolase